MKIDIYSDVVCPWCFIGKRHLETALTKCTSQAHDIVFEINWIPFQLNPEMPANGMARSDYLELKFGGQKNASRIYEQIRISGQRANITFNFDRIKYQPNTLLAHLLVAFVEELSPRQDIVETLFRAFFFDGQDLGHMDILKQIGNLFGVNSMELENYMRDRKNQNTIIQHNSTAHEMGIRGVPLFILDDTISISGAQPPEYFEKIILENFKESHR